MNAVYISPNSFSVSTDRTLEFIIGRRVKCDCDSDGIMYANIVSSTYSDPDTIIVINESSLTSNLKEILYGVVEPGPTGSLPSHDHSDTEGMGSTFPLINLSDTPATYSGTTGMVLRSTSSGVEWDTSSEWYFGSGVPTLLNPAEAVAGDLYFDEDTGDVHERLSLSVDPIKMWYQGNDGTNWRILYATSTDGISWTKQGIVLDIGTVGEDDEVRVQSPVVIKETDTSYKMWHSGHDGTSLRIRYATSTDGISWTKQGTVVDLGAGGEYDDLHVHTPFVIKESDTSYKMWYGGHDGANWRILYATSTNGISWAKQGIVLNLGAAGEDDDAQLHSPVVIKETATSYKMWYTGSDSINNRILYATSTDGISWTKQGTVVDLGTGGEDDDAHVASGDVIKESDTSYKMWYGGRDGTNWRTMYATSTDGISWTKQGTVVDLGAGGEDDDTDVTKPSVIIPSDDVWSMKSNLWISDYPTTYSGTEGAMLVSTGSGTEFTHEGRWIDGEGTPYNMGNIGNYYIDENTASIYKKNRVFDYGIFFTAKSVILEFADNWGGREMAIRSVEFKLDSVLVAVTQSDFTAYHSSTYNAVEYGAQLAFDTLRPKSGGNRFNGWHAATWNDTEEWLMVVFNTPIEFDEIIINNNHDDGVNPTVGVKNTRIYISPDIIASHVYGDPISNSTTVFGGEIAQHAAIDGADDQILILEGAQIDTGWDDVGAFAATPSSGTEGFYSRSTGSGIEWDDISIDFIELNDTPSTYNDNKYLRSTASGTEWADVSANLIDLNDTPSVYDEGKYLRSVVSGTEWSDVSANLVDLNDTPTTYDYGKALVSTTSGTEWGTATVTTVTGTILYGTGDPPAPAGYVDGTLFFKYVN